MVGPGVDEDDQNVPTERFAVFTVMNVMSVTVDLPDQYPMLTLQEAQPPLRQVGEHQTRRNRDQPPVRIQKAVVPDAVADAEHFA